MYAAFKKQTAPIDVDVMMLMPDWAAMNPTVTRRVVPDLGKIALLVSSSVWVVCYMGRTSRKKVAG